MRIIDFHNHLGRHAEFSADDEINRFLKIMDASGVDQACINCIYHYSGDHREGNNYVSEIVKKYPDRFIGVAYVSPLYPEEVIDELNRAFDVLNLKYLKIYPNYLQKPVNDPSYFPIFEWGNSRGIVIMCHASYIFDEPPFTRPKLFVELAKRFNKIKWVLAHSGNMKQGQIEAVSAAQQCNNIFLETASSWGEHGTIEYLVSEAGEDKILYGSDMPLLDARNQIGRIITANISNSAKQKILGENTAKLLNL